MTSSPFAEPIGLSRDPHWDDAWTNSDNQYVLPHPDNEFEPLVAGRASELGKTISNTFSLNRWHKEMVLKGVVMRRSILQRAAIALHDGLNRRQQSKVLWDLCKEAEETAGAKEPAALGTGLHKLTELYDSGAITLAEVPEPWDLDMVAYSEVLHRAGIVAVPEFTERIVWNRPINTAGRFDRLWRYLRHCDKWHVGDLKTGRTLDYGWLEIAVQLQVYATATHMFDTENRTWSPMPEMCTDVGLVLHVPSNGLVDEDGESSGGRMAALYEVDLSWKIPVRRGMDWAMTPTELAVAVQQWRKVKRLQKLLVRVEVTADGEVRDVPLSLSERIDLCQSRGEVEALWAEAKGRREWQGHHTTRAKQRLESFS